MGNTQGGRERFRRLGRLSAGLELRKTEEGSTGSSMGSSGVSLLQGGRQISVTDPPDVDGSEPQQAPHVEQDHLSVHVSVS